MWPHLGFSRLRSELSLVLYPNPPFLLSTYSRDGYPDSEKLTFMQKRLSSAPKTHIITIHFLIVPETKQIQVTYTYD